ncbi:hypothetical protein GQ54DRAFT_177841 [Martensiomyces pterosporus]|nr:hypothetical protein GQ54DRAFT_177841 [Martensiomyces pterosporus]
MIDPDDKDFFSWAPNARIPPDQKYRQYDFLMTVPLVVKRELFRATNSVLSDFSMSDMFNTTAQMRWVISIIKFGMQLPLEDIDLISDAFEQYSQVLFILHHLDFDDTETEKNTGETPLAVGKKTFEFVCRPGILFNPRVFFEDELPTKVLTHQISKQTVETPESCLSFTSSDPSISTDINRRLFERPESAKGFSLRAGTSHTNLQYPLSEGTDSIPGATARSTGSGAESSSVYLSPFTPKHTARRDDRAGSAPDHKPTGSPGRGRSPNAVISDIEGSSASSYMPTSRRPSLNPMSVHAEALPHTEAAEQDSRTKRRTKSRLARAVELWDQYVDLLSHVLQIYSTVIRGLKPSACAVVLPVIFKRLVLVVDLMLSQGGNNPRLKPWIERYRPRIGPEIWDRTWATIGDRLEPFGIKLVLDIWGRLVTTQNKDWDFLGTFSYWLHRPKVARAWILISGQVARCAIQSYYPVDDTIGVKKIRVQLAEFSISSSISGEVSRTLLHVHSGLPIDNQSIPSCSYYTYSNELCSIVLHALNIRRLIQDKGVWYGQRPPTANYLLYYFGNPLIDMVLRKDPVTKAYIVAKRNAINAICRMLVLREYEDDPLSSENRNRVIDTLREAIRDTARVQIMLPNSALLLRETPHIRPFIPSLFQLVRQVLPQPTQIPIMMDKDELRLSAMQVLSSLMGFVGYYHDIGRSDMIAYANHQSQASVYVQAPAEEAQASASSGYSLSTLIDKIAKSPFKMGKKKDDLFAGHLEYIFWTLLSSATTETDEKNLQYLTCLILAFLYQYDKYNPGYVHIYVMFYIDQLKATRDQKMAAVYIYGLTMAGMLTWNNVLSSQQHMEIISSLVHALSDCDRHLKRYTHWDLYHQVFIGSMRCLSTWVSTSIKYLRIVPELTANLTQLVSRCEGFLQSTTVDSPKPLRKFGRRVKLTTSMDDGQIVFMQDGGAVVSEASEDMVEPGDAESESELIISYTVLGLFAKSSRASLATATKTRSSQKVRVISESLYQVLSTTVKVFSTTLLRGLDRQKNLISRATPDVLLTRMVLYHSELPDTRTLLCNCCPAIIEAMEGYQPVSVEFYSAYRRSVYSKINFRRMNGGRWSDAAILYTSRYPSGTKQWVIFPTMPIPAAAAPTPPAPSSSADDHAEYPAFKAITDPELMAGITDQPSADTSAEPGSDTGRVRPRTGNAGAATQPWMRRAKCVSYHDVGAELVCFASVREQEKRVGFLLDEEGARAVLSEIAGDNERQSGEREAAELEFEPMQPLAEMPSSNNYYRTNMIEYHPADTAPINISEKLLQDIDVLDDYARPFTAHAGIIYLHSIDSLLGKRELSKGPLKGVSQEFSSFLARLGRPNATPTERLKRHPADAILMKYSFCSENFEVSYNMAPNVSSLIRGCAMDPGDNDMFYGLLRDRYVTVVWFDEYPGIMDTDMLWKFIDEKDNASPPPPPQPPHADAHLGAAAIPRVFRSEYVIAGHEQGFQWPKGRSSTESSRCDPRSKSNLHRVASSHSVSVSMLEGAGDKPARHRRKKSVPNECQITRLKPQNMLRKAIARGQKMSPYVSGAEDLRSFSAPGSRESSQSARSSTDMLDSNGGTISPVKSESLLPRNQSFTTAQEQLDTRCARGKKATSATESAATPPNPADAEGMESSAGKTEEAPETQLRFLITLVPVRQTRGRLTKIRLSASGGSERMNSDFVRMTGPLASEMVVQTKALAPLLSATIIDAAANIASLRGEDFSVVYKRSAMLTSIIKEHSVKHRTIEEAHKFFFPKGKGGIQNTLEIPLH